MEKKTVILQKEFTSGFFIELECFICMNKRTVAAASKKDLQVLIKDEGWQNLNSDKFGASGWHDGCDYKEV